MTKRTYSQGQSQLTPDQERKLVEHLEIATGMQGHIGFVCCPFLALDALERYLAGRRFHPVDGELFRARTMDTKEFCALLEWDAHHAFALFVPRLIPHAMCHFLYNAADDDLVCVEAGYPPEYRRKLNEKAWLVIMTPEDFRGAEMETGQDRDKLTRALSSQCHLD